MTRILIADASKPSIVMTSEVFKDKIPGAVIEIASSGQEVFDKIALNKPDLCVIDFDLPDSDGVSLITSLRKEYAGPILLTAYPDAIVDEAVSEHLFGFKDAGTWLKKPIKVEELQEKIDRFLEAKERIERRFRLSFMTQIIGKGAGRGKRAPKVNGKVVNISFGGACIRLESPLNIKLFDELMVSIPLPSGTQTLAPLPQKQSAKTPGAPEARNKGFGANAKNQPKKNELNHVFSKLSDTKIKATLAWKSEKGDLAGFRFDKLTAIQKRGLEALLRATDDGSGT